MATINLNKYTKFVVTGKTVRGGRFRQSYEATNSGAMTAFGINLWRGNVWGVRKDNGKRKRLKTVFN